jgi:hypothetical protein
VGTKKSVDIKGLIIILLQTLRTSDYEHEK